MQRALIQGVFAEEPWQGSGEGSRSARGPFKLLPATLRRRGQHRLVEAGLRSGVHVEILDPANDVDDSGANAAALSGAKAPVSESALDDVPAPRPQLDLFGTMQ
jgi:hypothetical protein